MSRVYFVSSRADSKERTLVKYRRLLAKFNMGRFIKQDDLTAIKVSFGERGNFTYLRPQYVRVVVDEVKRLGGRPFLTDANTLYAGGRQNSRDHLITAIENGFDYSVTGAPIIIADGVLGHDYRTVRIKGDYFDEVRIASAARDADAIISLAHFKGHMVCGFGGTIKNIGMGLGARAGKQTMHSDVHPEVKSSHCNGCFRCIKWCPEEAISKVPSGSSRGKAKDKIALIDDEACIGCGECVATCFTDAIAINWKSDPAIVQQKMAEYALGVVSGKRRKFAAINYIIDVTPDCDCLGWSDNPIVPNIGIAASSDPVAVDAASLDMVNHARGISSSILPGNELQSRDKFGSVHSGIDPWAQLIHGQKIGLGKHKYELTRLDKD